MGNSASNMEVGLPTAGLRWDATQPGARPVSPEGLRGSGSGSSKDSTETAMAMDGAPRRKPGRPPQTKTCRVCALDLAGAGLKGYYLVSAAGSRLGGIQLC